MRFLKGALIMECLRLRHSGLRGRQVSTLRQRVGEGDDCDVELDESECFDRFRSINRVSITDMPPAPDDVWVMIEMLSFRLGSSGVRGAWAAIGVNQRTGEGYLRNTNGITWPVWKTLRDAAFKGDVE